MAVSLGAEPTPPGMGEELLLGQSHRTVGVAHQRVDARAVGLGVVVAVLRIAVRQRHRVDGLCPPLIGGEADDGHVRPDDGACLFGDMGEDLVHRQRRPDHDAGGGECLQLMRAAVLEPVRLLQPGRLLRCGALVNLEQLLDGGGLPPAADGCDRVRWRGIGGAKDPSTGEGQHRHLDAQGQRREQLRGVDRDGRPREQDDGEQVASRQHAPESEHRLHPVGQDELALSGDVRAAHGVGDVEDVVGLLVEGHGQVGAGLEEVGGRQPELADQLGHHREAGDDLLTGQRCHPMASRPSPVVPGRFVSRSGQQGEAPGRRRQPVTAARLLGQPPKVVVERLQGHGPVEARQDALAVALRFSQAVVEVVHHGFRRLLHRLGARPRPAQGGADGDHVGEAERTEIRQEARFLTGTDQAMLKASPDGDYRHVVEGGPESPGDVDVAQVSREATSPTAWTASNTRMPPPTAV